MSKYSGMSWIRAKAGIALLVEAGLAECTHPGKRPRYKLTKPVDPEELIWLPNELIGGAAGETPPIARLRQTQDIDVLQMLVDLYGEHDLAGDGGLPRDLVYHPFKKKHLMEMGQFTVFGFSDEGTRYCTNVRVLERYSGQKNSKGGAMVWEHLTTLQKLGLLKEVTYLAESDKPNAELLHPLNGDEHADRVYQAITSIVLPGGFAYESENFAFTLPVLNHMQNAAVVGVYRLHYRPKTSRTAAWFAKHVEACESFATLYGQLAQGQFRRAL